MKIGFIGLGHMGQPMAINCLQKGMNSLFLINRSRLVFLW